MRNRLFMTGSGFSFRTPHSALCTPMSLVRPGDRYRRAGVACCLLLLTGCAALPLPFPLFQQEPASSQQTSILDDGYTDYAGVIHIHTTYSPDAHGTFADVI